MNSFGYFRTKYYDHVMFHSNKVHYWHLSRTVMSLIQVIVCKTYFTEKLWTYVVYTDSNLYFAGVILAHEATHIDGATGESGGYISPLFLKMWVS